MGSGKTIGATSIMKHPLLAIIAGIVFLSSCANIVYLFPKSNEFRTNALRASEHQAPEAVPSYLQAAENVIGYQFALILICFACSLVLLICLVLKRRTTDVE